MQTVTGGREDSSMQTVISDAESTGRGQRCRRCCGCIVVWVLKSLSLSYDESGDGWRVFAFSPVSHNPLLLCGVGKWYATC